MSNQNVDFHSAAPGAVYFESRDEDTGDTALSASRARQVANDKLADKPLSREEVENIIWEIKNQPHWRKEANKCADYKDGNQLSSEAIETLRERGQPDLITNLIKPTIDVLVGIEAMNKTDWVVRPEDDGACSDDLAEALSMKLKTAEIETMADRALSDAYDDQITTGIGWVEVSYSQNVLASPYRVRRVHRRELFWDWKSELSDLTDAKWLVRRRWIDVNDACAMFPSKADILSDSVSLYNREDEFIEEKTDLIHSREIERETTLDEFDWRDITREQVCLYEIWYRKWVMGYVMRLPGGGRVPFNETNPRHLIAVSTKTVQLQRAIFPRVRLAWYAGCHALTDISSPYDHRYFPYIPFFGFREDLTGAPYGYVRGMISPQDEINARKSKQLWHLSTRRIVADEDAVVDWEATAEEAARADAVIKLNPRRRPTSQFKIEEGTDLSEQQYQALLEAKQNIQDTTGIYKAMLGQNSNANTGVAINSLVEQGLKTTAGINDNYRFSRRIVGEVLFSLVKQDLEGLPLPVKIGEGRNQKIVVLNQPAIDPATGAPAILNDVSKVKVKIALDDIPSSPTFRVQQLTSLTEIVKSMPPQLQAGVMDFIVEATDLPNKHEIAERLRSLLNLKSPEEMEAVEQAQNAEAARQADIAQKLTALEAAKKAAEIRKLNADADKSQAAAKASLLEAGR
jgi:hypothetical protein